MVIRGGRALQSCLHLPDGCGPIRLISIRILYVVCGGCAAARLSPARLSNRFRRVPIIPRSAGRRAICRAVRC